MTLKLQETQERVISRCCNIFCLRMYVWKSGETLKYSSSLIYRMSVSNKQECFMVIQ